MRFRLSKNGPFQGTLVRGKTLKLSPKGDSLSRAVLPIKSQYLIGATSGSYTFAGQSANLLRGYLLTAQAGSYTFNGQQAILSKGRVLTAQAGAYTFAGQSATLTRSYALVAQPGAYSFVGQDAIITYTPGSAGYTLTAEAGSYTFAGQSATITVSSSSSTVEPIGLIPGRNSGYDPDSYMARLLGPPIEHRIKQQLVQTIEEAAQEESPAPVVEKQVETVLTQALSDNERQAWLAAYTEVFVSLYLTRLQEQAAERLRRQQEADDEAQAVVMALLML